MVDCKLLDVTAEDIITLIISFISLQASSFMLINFIQSDNKDRVLTRLIALLALGDFGWAATNIFYGIVSIFIGGEGTSCIKDWCIFARISVSFWGLETVIIVTIIALYILIETYSPISLQTQFSRNTLFWVFSIFTVVVSAILTTLLMTWGKIEIDPTGWCYPNDRAHVFFWFIPVAICFLISLVIYLVILFRYVSIVKEHNIRATSKIPFRISCFVLAFIATWTFDIVSYFYYEFGKHIPLWLSIMTALTINAQGIFDFLVYGILNGDLRKKYSAFWGTVVFVLAPILLPVVMIRSLKSNNSSVFPNDSEDIDNAKLREDMTYDTDIF